MRNSKKFIKYFLILFLVISPINAKDKTNNERRNFWLDIYKGEPISQFELIDDIKKVQIIYLGEIHTIKRHHNLQKKIVEELIKSGKTIILGLEHMEAFYQNELDRFNKGEIDFSKLAEVTQWSERRPNYKAYKPIIEYVHNNKGKVLALNARQEIIKKTAKKGITNLSKEDRKQLPGEINIEDKDHEKLLGMMLKVHAMMDPEKLQPVIEAQMARDEMMAHVISKYIKDSMTDKSIMVIISGAMHCNYSLGIPIRLKRRIPEIKDRIILFSESGDLVLSAHEKAMARKINITHEDLRYLKTPIADYLQIIERK